MKRTLLISLFLLGAALITQAQEPCTHPLTTFKEPLVAGRFKPTWKSLEQYKVPQWYQNAKFGIWAHWGPQCEPEHGDWYARGMYEEGSGNYKWHREHYGPQSKFGFKDIIHQWKAANWNPEKLVKLYKRCGAQYFFAMANHHDNFDLWDSKYHNWNATKLGPHKNIIAGWAAAARHNKLPFGVSVHASHAWMFYEPAQLADTVGQYKGIPYDGKLTKADGKGTWWEGLDPQELYAQNHAKTVNQDSGKQWEWGNGAVIPDQAYCEDFYNRTMDLINKYNPDLIYFDDTALPLWPVSDAGLYIASNFYNKNMKLHGGKLEGVIFGKILNEQQQKCLVWDVERGALDKINPRSWQTCSCIGGWHYDRGLYDRNGYKSAKTVIQMLSDIVSKNGNLLLNIPVRRDGTIDEKEEAILEGIAGWMDINKESIFGTRPWTIFGEGPDAEHSHELKAQGFNEGQSKYTSSDVRFTKKGKAIYAILMERPSDGKVCIKSFSSTSTHFKGQIKEVRVLGFGKMKYTQSEQGLTLTLPTSKNFVPVLKVILK